MKWFKLFKCTCWSECCTSFSWTSDINECRNYPGRLCAHKCENILGSYKCSCTTGFKLAADGRNCDGTEKPTRATNNQLFTLLHSLTCALTRPQWVWEKPVQSGVCERLRLVPVLLPPRLSAERRGRHQLWR